MKLNRVLLIIGLLVPTIMVAQSPSSIIKDESFCEVQFFDTLERQFVPMLQVGSFDDYYCYRVENENLKTISIQNRFSPYQYVLSVDKNGYVSYIEGDGNNYRLDKDQKQLCILFSKEELQISDLILYIPEMGDVSLFSKIIRIITLASSNDIRYALNTIGFSARTDNIVPVFVELK